MTDFTDMDPRRLREMLDTADCIAGLLDECLVKVMRQYHGCPEVCDDTLNGLHDLLRDSRQKVERIQQAIDASPEAQESRRREQPRPSWE